MKLADIAEVGDYIKKPDMPRPYKITTVDTESECYVLEGTWLISFDEVFMDDIMLESEVVK